MRLRRRLATWLRLYESVGVPADVNTRISHLAQRQCAAFEHAPAAGGPSASRQAPAEELLSREFPEWQSVERYQDGTDL